MSKSRTYPSEDIDVHYDVKRCIHAEACVRGAPTVFDPNKRPWIDPAEADADTIAEVITRCPTGALHFTRKDGGVSEAPDTTNTISVDPDGPLFVRGTITFISADGSVTSRETRIAFCRCGLSKNKPYCDNSHLDGFSDDGTLGVYTSTELATEAEALTVSPSENGPLLFRGPVVISSVDGTEVTTEKCALCRCGQSSNKPFCDGTHKEVGFQAPLA